MLGTEGRNGDRNHCINPEGSEAKHGQQPRISTVERDMEFKIQSRFYKRTRHWKVLNLRFKSGVAAMFSGKVPAWVPSPALEEEEKKKSDGDLGGPQV